MNINTDELFVERIRNSMDKHGAEWLEKKMFGGLCFMVDDKMCLGTYKGGIMARTGPEEMEKLLKKKGAEPMIHGGRPMKGYVFVQPEGYQTDEELDFWIGKCLEYNPIAKSSKKKKKK